MSTPENEGAFEVVWPDESIYRNRHGQTRLTEAEARATAPLIGGRWRLAVDCGCGHPASAHDAGIGICDDCYCNAYRKAA